MIWINVALVLAWGVLALVTAGHVLEVRRLRRDTRTMLVDAEECLRRAERKDAGARRLWHAAESRLRN